jgi:hypothetical protein
MNNKFRRTKGNTIEAAGCTTGILLNNILYCDDEIQAIEETGERYKIDREELYECAISIMRSKIHRLTAENAELKEELELRKKRIVVD